MLDLSKRIMITINTKMANNDPWGVTTNDSEISSGKKICNNFDVLMSTIIGFVILSLQISIKQINQILSSVRHRK